MMRLNFRQFHTALLLSPLLSNSCKGLLNSGIWISHNILPSHVSLSSQKSFFHETKIAWSTKKKGNPPPWTLEAQPNKFVQNESKGIKEEELQKRLGQAKQRVQKSVSRENRIAALEQKLNDTVKGRSDLDMNIEPISESEKAELNGLLNVRQKFEEQYDPLTFTQEHFEFKQMHNDVFIALSQYCQQQRHGAHEIQETDGMKPNAFGTDGGINIFFLDGPDGGTASALIGKGNFLPSQCFVANRHESTCKALRMSGGGCLPDTNVIFSSAAEAFMIMDPEIEAPLGAEGGAFAAVDFAAYYFDGCGGFVPLIVEMMSAALRDCEQAPICVGYSILGGNKDVVEKELEISQALTAIARRKGMRMVHALDDCQRYGISPAVKKTGGGGTFTTWLILEPSF